MKVAFSIWNQRIAPVFDVSRRVLVLEVENTEVQGRSEQGFEEFDPFAKLERLCALGVRALVCGAISRPLSELAQGLGIKLFPFIAGEVDEVIEAYLNGGLSSPALAMPGCRRRARMMGRRPFGSTHITDFERRHNMPNQDGSGPSGKGPGTGRGKGGCGAKGSKRGGQKGQGAGGGQGAGSGQGRGRGTGRNRSN